MFEFDILSGHDQMVTLKKTNFHLGMFLDFYRPVSRTFLITSCTHTAHTACPLFFGYKSL